MRTRRQKAGGPYQGAQASPLFRRCGSFPSRQRPLLRHWHGGEDRSSIAWHRHLVFRPCLHKSFAPKQLTYRFRWELWERHRWERWHFLSHLQVWIQTGPLLGSGLWFIYTSKPLCFMEKLVVLKKFHVSFPCQVIQTLCPLVAVYENVKSATEKVKDKKGIVHRPCVEARAEIARGGLVGLTF